MRSFIKLLRLHQWIKNGLIFLPILTAWYGPSHGEWLKGLALFIALSCLASTTYVINDFLDLESDKKNPQTSHRPLASGTVSLRQACVLGCMSFVLACIAMSALPFVLNLLLFLYVILSLSYSLKLKKIPILDVLLLSVFYVLRIFMGLILFNLELSLWLMGFAFFFFFSIGLIKRCSELYALHKAGVEINSRGYVVGDYNFLQMIGMASGVISIVIFTNYINSDVVASQYSSPVWLGGISLVLFFGIVRIWFLQNRHTIVYDPVTFFLKDRVTYFILGLVGCFIFLAHT